MVKLRVAFFVGTFPVVSETFIVRQIAALIEMGHEIEIFSDVRAEMDPAGYGEIEQYNLLDKTTCMNLPPETAPWEMPVFPLTGVTWPPGSEKPMRNLRRVARAAPAFLRCFARAPKLAVSVLKRAEYRYQAASLSALQRLAKLSSLRRRFDVLHAHFGPVGNSFRFARALWRAPLIVSFHGYDFCTLPRKEGNSMYGRLFETADAITVNSEYTRARVEKLGCPPAKLHTLPVGLNPDKFFFRERTLRSGETVRILSVGRLVEIKGHEFVIRAVAKLRERHPALRLGIVGAGPLRPHLEKLIAQLRLEGAVVLHGAQRNSFVRQLMSDAHLFVLASVSVEGDQEGQGLALQEAQACGLPVVATRHGAFPEGVLDGESGFLVAERDADALADRLKWLIENPDRWAMLGRCGRKFVEERYDIRQLTRQLTAIYAKAIGHFRNAA